MKVLNKLEMAKRAEVGLFDVKTFCLDHWYNFIESMLQRRKRYSSSWIKRVVYTLTLCFSRYG